jgi:hypothetical protein
MMTRKPIASVRTFYRFYRMGVGRMKPARIAMRETLEYAMSLPTIIQVDIKHGVTLADRLDTVYPHLVMQREIENERGKTISEQSM